MKEKLFENSFANMSFMLDVLINGSSGNRIRKNVLFVKVILLIFRFRNLLKELKA
jgi:hypothetical protein